MYSDWFIAITFGNFFKTHPRCNGSLCPVWISVVYTVKLTATGNGIEQFTTSNGSGGWYSLVRTQGISINLSGYNYIKIISESSPEPSEYGEITVNGINYVTENYIGTIFKLNNSSVSFAGYRYDNTGGSYIDSSVTIQYWK